MRKMLSDSILDLRKCPNRKTHESESAYFWFGHFARSKIKSESIFLIITILKNIVFSNLSKKGLGFFFKLGG